MLGCQISFKAYLAHCKGMRYHIAIFCLLCALATIILTVTYTGLKQPDATPSAYLKEAGGENSREPVKILIWTKVFESWEKHLSSTSRGLVPYNGCKVPCFLTRDRSLIRAVDAIVIHDRDADGNDLPKYRAAQQRWVYWNLESPDNSRIKGIGALKDVFNWTYTYRHDSDAHHPYITVRRRAHTDSSAPPFVTSTNRSKLAVWAASNCATRSGREKFVAELRKNIPVDIYGKCGDLKCPRGHECLVHFGKTYFFYLALENSLCPDYVTEKFYNALHYGMVPVVLGNYSKLAPAGSYINALEFPSPKHLAAYLKIVAANSTRYKQYFAWRRYYDIDVHRSVEHCPLCEALHMAGPEDRKMYKDIIHWWHGNGSLCTTWKPVM